MHTPATIAGHPLHPMLVPIPIGLWIASLACDLWAYLLGGPAWLPVVAFVTMVGGVIGALLAVGPGLIDGFSLKDGPRRIAMVHMSLNVAIVLMYLLNITLRWNGNETLAPLALSVVSVGALLVSGWLGGKMVYLQRVGVEEPQPLQRPQPQPQHRAL